jgi:hypothetical protein
MMQYSKFIKLPRRTLMDVIDDHGQVGKHVVAYRKAALHCLGYYDTKAAEEDEIEGCTNTTIHAATADDDDDNYYYEHRGRIEVGVMERISIVHFHPSVIPILLSQEEGQQITHGGSDSRNSSSDRTKRKKLDQGRIPYALGQSLGMTTDEPFVSPTLDSSGRITHLALPNYSLNYAAIDVANAIMAMEARKNQQRKSRSSSSCGGSMMTMNSTNPVSKSNVVHNKLSIEELKQDNLRLMIMFFKLAERYDQEVKARRGYEQLASLLQDKLDKMESLLKNSDSNQKYFELRSVRVGEGGGHATPAINTTNTVTNSASNDSKSDNQVYAVAELLEQLHNEKRRDLSPSVTSGGSLGQELSTSSFSSAATVRGRGGGGGDWKAAGKRQRRNTHSNCAVEASGHRTAKEMQSVGEHDVTAAAVLAHSSAGSLSTQGDAVIGRHVSMEPGETI